MFVILPDFRQVRHALERRVKVDIILVGTAVKVSFEALGGQPGEEMRIAVFSAGGVEDFSEGACSNPRACSLPQGS